MKGKVGWLALVLGFLIFVGYVVYTTTASAQVSCEVCLVLRGQTVCRAGSGATAEEARRAAQESACGGNTSGMEEMIACRGMAPAGVQCTGP